MVVAEPMRRPKALLTVSDAFCDSPEVVIWFIAKRVLLSTPLLMLTRASSAPDIASVRRASSRASASLRYLGSMVTLLPC